MKIPNGHEVIQLFEQFAPKELAMEGDKIAVKGPSTYVWGYSAPYKILTRTETGVDVVENGTVIQSVPADEYILLHHMC